MNDERCAKCKHFKRVKHHNHEEGWIWFHFHICDLFLNEKDGWGITVTEYDMCECFEEDNE